MNKIVNVPANVFGKAQLPAAFEGAGGGEELGAGVTGGFGIVTFRGKVWRTKYRGDEVTYLAPDGRNPRPELEVVIVRAATTISKTFYKDNFVEGSVAPPDCWSVNGVVPDPAAPDKQSPTCGGCPQNAWGSRVTEAGKKAKACSDNKRLVVVPADDILNESLGGPMMLRIPPTSLQDMATFGAKMKGMGFPYYSFVTRLRFDPDAAHPKIVFEAVRPLDQQQAELVMQLRNNEVTMRILNAPVIEARHDTDERAEQTSVVKGAEELFSPEAAQKLAEVQTQPEQDGPVQQELPLSTIASQAPAAAPTRPLFDPMTGEKIVYPDEKPADTRPKFDPMTGEKIVYKEDQSFPDIPSGLVRNKKTKAVKAEPKPEDAKVGGSFEDALDGLLSSKK